MDPVLRETVEIVGELAALRARNQALNARLAELKTELATDADPGRYRLEAGPETLVMAVRTSPTFPYRTKEPELFDRFSTAARRSRWWPLLSDLSHRNARGCWKTRTTIEPGLRDLLADFVSERRSVTLTLERGRTRPTIPA